MSRARKNNTRKKDRLLLNLASIPTEVLEVALQFANKLTHGKERSEFRLQAELFLQKKPCWNKPMEDAKMAT